MTAFSRVCLRRAPLSWYSELNCRRRVVLAIDEAHLLSPEQLEEIRLLTNQEMDSKSPFAGILLGQPTLSRQRAWECSPRSIRESPPATRFLPWILPSWLPTCATISVWWDVQIRCCRLARTLPGSCH